MDELMIYTLYNSTTDFIFNHQILFTFLVGFPLFTFLIIKLVWSYLRRTVKKAKITVRKMKEAVSHGHILDLEPGFIAKVEKSGLYCKLTSLASYVNSLDYGNDDDVAYRIIATLVGSIGGDQLAPLLPLVPASLVPSRNSVRFSGILARFTLSEFPSILILTAMVEGAARASAQSPDPEKNIKLPPNHMDSMDLLARGEAPGVLPELSAKILTMSSLSLSTEFPLRHFVENEIDLGYKPDSKHYDFPKPFSPDLLPGLCKGNGGLEHTCTPRMMAQNRVLAVILNRLASNFMSWAGYGGAATLTPYQEFKVIFEEAEDKPIYTCGEFIRHLHEKGGGSLKATIRTNITAFGIGLCVLDENAPPPPEVEDPTDASRRLHYTQIPLAFCSRTGVTNPTNGDAVHQLSTHSSVEWTFVDNKYLGEGEVVVQFYTGVEGFTGFKAGGEWNRPWVFEAQRLRELYKEECYQAADLGACESVCANVCVRVWAYPWGGYGSLGVCADSVALVEHVLRGRTTIFPLFMRADSKCGLLYAIHEHIRVRLLACLEKKQIPSEDVRSHHITEFLNSMNEVARHLIQLPNDIQVEPQEISDAIDRILSSNMGSPFNMDQFELGRLKHIKDGWNTALREFQTDFEGFRFRKS